MKHQIAFAGFQHPHIFSLLDRVRAHADCEVVAAAEANPQTRDDLASGGRINPAYSTLDSLLAEKDCSIVAIGDVYARRGALAIAALKAGRHIISDKPVCTSLAELDQISDLAREKNLSVGCQLDLIESGAIRSLHQVIHEGTIGTVCTINITAQHPLRLGSRAAWYFEPGLHGGTINDIGVHVSDLAPWLAGSRWKTLLAAREWNAKAAGVEHFKDCAQFFATLESGASCFADLSYLAPDKLGYELPQYWRVTVHGTKGMAEAGYTLPTVTVVTDADTAPQQLPAVDEAPAGYLQDFLDEIAGSPSPDGLTTERVLYAARHALETQAAAAKQAV